MREIKNKEAARRQEFKNTKNREVLEIRNQNYIFHEGDLVESEILGTSYDDTILEPA